MIQNKTKKNIFFLMAFITFIMVAVYEYLTPVMSDDIFYGGVVSGAKNIFDLFGQEYDHYLHHSGRNVAHIILRFFLFSGNKVIFDIVAALVFTLESILIYLNVDAREKYDIRIYGVILCFLWFFDPAISNTVFWETGACNYLFTGTIVLGYVTLFRKHMKLESETTVGLMIKLAVLGLLAGWCNENTSGGVILVTVILLAYKWLQNSKSFKFLKPWMVVSLVANLIGFAFMIASPGNYSRAEGADEEHTGFMALMARFLKIVLNIKENYLVLTVMFVVLLIFVAYVAVDKRKFMEMTRTMRFFGFIALATAFALIAVPSSQIRTYYGAGLFLMIAVANGVAIFANTKLMSGSASDQEKGLAFVMQQTAVTSAVVVALLILMFSYIENGANLARIKREFNERDAYLQELADKGEIDVYAPKLRPQWDNRFSFAYQSDLDEDYHFWINQFYAEKYGFDTVSGVEREEWTEY